MQLELIELPFRFATVEGHDAFMERYLQAKLIETLRLLQDKLRMNDGSLTFPQA